MENAVSEDEETEAVTAVTSKKQPRRVLSIGAPISGAVSIPRQQPVSHANFLEYELLLFDVRSIEALRQAKHLPETQTPELVVLASKDLREYVESGKVLVVWPAPLHSLKAEQWSYSDVKSGLELAHIPTNCIPSRGEAIKAVSPPFSTFLEQCGVQFAYDCRYEPGDHSIGLVTVANSHRCVGSALVSGQGGVVVCLPQPKQAIGEQINEFTEAVLELARAIRAHAKTVHPPLPHWALSYELPGQSSIQKEIQALEASIAEMAAVVEQKRNELQRIEDRKRLFTGHDEELAVQVEQALTTLGFRVEPGEPGRADRIAHYGDRSVAIEIKGKEKSADESKDFAQLMRWKMDYLEAHGEDPKGLLIINAFRKEPLSERLGAKHNPPFPDAIVRRAQKSGDALVTGLQLLNMMIAAEADPSQAPKLAELIFATEGALEGFSDIPPIRPESGELRAQKKTTSE